MKTKNGMVTLQVPEGDLKSIFNAIDCKVQDMKKSPSSQQQEKGIELAHSRTQLTDQAMAQGWKSM